MKEHANPFKSKVFLLFACGAMEISWIYAWAVLLTLPLIHRPFPWVGGVMIFGLTAGLSFYTKGRGWLGIQIIGAHLAVLVVTVLTFVNPISYVGKPWAMVMIIFWVLSFWIGGITFAWRTPTHQVICHRFEIAVGAFILLLFIYCAFAKDANYPEYLPEILLFPFFGSSLLALGLARTQGRFAKEHFEGYQGKRMMNGFFTVVIGLVSGSFLLFLPYLMVRIDYHPLQHLTSQFASWVTDFLRFVFTHLNWHPYFTINTTQTEGFNRPTVPIVFIQDHLGHVFIGIFYGLIALGIGTCLFGIFRNIYQWLFSKTTVTRETKISVWQWLGRIWALLMFYGGKLWRCSNGWGINRIYQHLLAWGRSVGIPCAVNETPFEYAIRLQNNFPWVGQEIQLIVETFAQEAYGAIIPSQQQLVSLQAAWLIISSPLQWLMHFKWYRMKKSIQLADQQY